jgi:REP element-mobilizing transposase RayT
MPDHLHWLVKLEGCTLDELMRRIKSNSARRINRCLGRTGPVWQQGYHDRALRREEDLQVAARYVVANPLRAGLVERLADYPHWDAVWL